MPGPESRAMTSTDSGATDVPYEDFTTLGVFDDIAREFRDHDRQFPECRVIETSQVRDLDRGPSRFSDLRCIVDGYENLVMHPISIV